jgi:glycerophosphoryl diester phosphodiesterase
VALGADAAELDVHRTADGVIVVHHDPVIAGVGAITTLTAAQVTAVRVRDEPIPTLRQVFATVGADLRLYVELKGADTVPGVLDVIRAQRADFPGSEDRSAVHCFDHRLVAQAAQLDPSVARGVLEVSYPVEPTTAARPVGARDVWRHRDFVDEALVKAAHAERRRVVAWTVNDAAMIRRFAAWGVDAICTDDVALARATLRA